MSEPDDLDKFAFKDPSGRRASQGPQLPGDALAVGFGIDAMRDGLVPIPLPSALNGLSPTELLSTLGETHWQHGKGIGGGSQGAGASFGAALDALVGSLPRHPPQTAPQWGPPNHDDAEDVD